jgi:hypothetical protein
MEHDMPQEMPETGGATLRTTVTRTTKEMNAVDEIDVVIPLGAALADVTPLPRMVEDPDLHDLLDHRFEEVEMEEEMMGAAEEAATAVIAMGSTNASRISLQEHHMEQWYPQSNLSSR